MKIVHEVNQLDFGGVERVVRNIIKFDKKNKHVIITYRDGAYRPYLEAVGAEIVVLKDETDDVEMNDVDCLHIHTGGAHSRMALELGEHFNIIETIHSPVRSAVPQNKVKQRVGVSEAVAKMNSNCITIKNGLDVEEFYSSNTLTPEAIRGQLGIAPNAKVIGRLGRLGKDKGIEDYLLTCYYLQQKGHDIVPVVVGSASEIDKGFAGKMKLLAECLPVKNVIWVGHRADTFNYLQIMDIFLYPSPTEGFGLVFAEAMLAGCGVVTYRTEVTQELFGGFSILTERNIPALVRGCERMLNDSLRVEFQGISASHVEQEYDARRMSEQYQELYECNSK